MTDYTHVVGSGPGATLMIRDTGSGVEFWINSNNGTTWSDHLPWTGVVNGVGVSGHYYYHPGSGWNKIVAYGVSASQNVTFGVGATGTQGFDGPNSFTVFINRGSAPQAPNPVVLSSITDTSMHAVFTGNGDGGAGIFEWQIGWGTDPNNVQNIIHTFDSVLTGLTSGVTYYFWARGTNSHGAGPWSARSSATTLRIPDAPGAPVLANVTQTAFTLAVFAVNGDGGTALTGFEIYFATVATTPPTTPGSLLSLASLPLVESGLIPGTTYFVWVRTKNAIGYSPWSAMSSTTSVAGVRVKASGVWKQAIPYVRDGGVWKLARPWGKLLGTWKETG